MSKKEITHSDKLLKRVKSLSDPKLKADILREYQECGDILEACDRLRMFGSSLEQLKEADE